MRRARVLPFLLLIFGACAASACRSTPAPSSQAEPDSAAPDGEAPTASASASASAASAPPPPVSPESARRGDALDARAEHCLLDLHCSLPEATRLYLEAADAGATTVNCFRLYYGAAVPADLPRARTCFERAVAREKDFAGSSPSLQRVFLGLMLFDAQGGPRDVKRGDALFAECYLGNDSGVRVAAEERAKKGGTKPVDFCADIGGTTLDTNACAEVEQDRATVKASIEAKEIVRELALDAAGFALWDKAEAAWSNFSVADARYVGDAYRDGSMRIAQETSVAAAHAHERVEALQALLTPKSPPLSSPSSKEAEADLARASTRARDAARDAQNKKLLAEAEAAWRAYRTAEIAFVRRAFAGKYGSEAAAASAGSAELAARRATGLLETVKALRGE